MSSSSSIAAWAPNRRASAASAERSALSRCTRANPPATSASTRTPRPRRATAEPAVRAPLTNGLVLARLAARAQELAFELVQFERVVGRPVQRGRQAGAAIELAWVLFRAGPAARRLDEVRVEQAPGAILLDPSARRAPKAPRDHLDPFGDGEQTPVGEDLDHARPRCAQRRTRRAGPSPDQGVALAGPASRTSPRVRPLAARPAGSVPSAATGRPDAAVST